MEKKTHSLEGFGDDSTTMDHPGPKAEARLLAKLDAAFVPIIMAVYLTCFLDRTNIGNVKVAGMPKDIGASDEEFATAVSIFYATYVAFETPWTILLKYLTPRVVLAGLCTVWSLVTIASGFMHNVAALYATRLILGVCEGGLFPSLNLYLTMVYKREEQAKRVSYLFVCAAIAGAFGGLLAYAILQMDGVANYPGWRWVYIIEGLISLLVAPVIWFGLPNDPAQAWFLTEDDKVLMQIRAKERAAYMGSEKFDWNEVKIAATDIKVYISGLIQFMQDILLYGFSTFLPSIIVTMGFSGLQAQYLSIPVYIVGGLFFLLFAFFSDRTMMRGAFCFLANLPGMLGYILFLCPVSGGVKFFGTFLCAVAVYSGPGLNLTWLNVNIAPHYRRATAIGLQQSIGNTAGIVAGQIYRSPPYVLGNAFSLTALGVSQLLIVLNWFYIRQQNRLKQKILNQEAEDRRRVVTGDGALDFEYHL